jgi:biotin carboxylase
VKHILQVGAYDVNLDAAARAGVRVSLLQLPERVTERQRQQTRRLVAVDYTREELAVEAARALHAQDPVDGVISFTEYGLWPAAAIRQALGCAGNPLEPVCLTRDKVAMRARMEQQGFPTVRYRRCASAAELLAFWEELDGPMIVKPVRGTGSEGVCLVSRRDELDPAWTGASVDGVVLAEQFVVGPEISVETLTLGGRHELVAVTEKITTGPPNFVEIGHQLPAPLTGARQQAASMALEFLALVGHELGPAHTEIRLSEQGPRLIESQTRPGGGFIWEMVELATGVDLVAETLAHLAGVPAPTRAPVAQAGAIRFFAESERVVSGVSGLEEARALPGVYRLQLELQPGQRLGPLSGNDDRQGYVIALASSLAQAAEQAELAHRTVRIS